MRLVWVLFKCPSANRDLSEPDRIERRTYSRRVPDNDDASRFVREVLRGDALHLFGPHACRRKEARPDLSDWVAMEDGVGEHVHHVARRLERLPDDVAEEGACARRAGLD